MSGILLTGAELLGKVGAVIADGLAQSAFRLHLVSLADVQARSIADGAPYQRSIDGNADGDPQTLTLDGGTISYQFLRLGPAVDAALQLAQEASPDPGGAYSRAWFVLVAGQPWTLPTSQIPANEVAYVVNFMPYHRRLEQGWHRARNPHHRPGLYITESVSTEVNRRFPYVATSREFVPLTAAPPGGSNAEVPYIRRRGDERGAPISYPAISLSLRS